MAYLLLSDKYLPPRTAGVFVFWFCFLPSNLRQNSFFLLILGQKFLLSSCVVSFFCTSKFLFSNRIHWISKTTGRHHPEVWALWASSSGVLIIWLYRLNGRQTVIHTCICSYLTKGGGVEEVQSCWTLLVWRNPLQEFRGGVWRRWGFIRIRCVWLESLCLLLLNNTAGDTAVLCVWF